MKAVPQTSPCKPMISGGYKNIMLQQQRQPIFPYPPQQRADSLTTGLQNPIIALKHYLLENYLSKAMSLARFPTPTEHEEDRRDPRLTTMLSLTVTT